MSSLEAFKCTTSVALDRTENDKVSIEEIPPYEMPTADTVSNDVKFQLDNDEDKDRDDHD